MINTWNSLWQKFHHKCNFMWYFEKTKSYSYFLGLMIRFFFFWIIMKNKSYVMYFSIQNCFNFFVAWQLVALAVLLPIGQFRTGKTKKCIYKKNKRAAATFATFVWNLIKQQTKITENEVVGRLMVLFFKLYLQKIYQAL